MGNRADIDIDDIIYDDAMAGQGIHQSQSNDRQNAGYNKNSLYDILPMGQHQSPDSFNRINIKESPNGAVEIEALYGDEKFAKAFYEHERQMVTSSQKAMLDGYQMQLGYLQDVIRQQNQSMMAMQSQFQFLLDIRDVRFNQQRIEMQDMIKKMGIVLIDTHQEFMKLRNTLINILPADETVKRELIYANDELADTRMTSIVALQEKTVDRVTTLFAEMSDDSEDATPVEDAIRVRIIDEDDSIESSSEDIISNLIVYEEDYDLHDNSPLIIEDLDKRTIMVEIPRRTPGMASNDDEQDVGIGADEIFEVAIPYNSQSLGVGLQKFSPVVTTTPKAPATVIPRDDGSAMRIHKPWVDYIKKRHTAVEYFDILPTSSLTQSDGNKVSLVSAGVDQLDVFTHRINRDKFITINPKDTKNGPYWEAFDIPFNGKWKKIVATQLKGISQAKIAIVRLISQKNSYVTLYTNSNAYGKAFDAMAEEKAAQGEDTSLLTISYDARCDHPTYGHIVSALAYAYAMAGETEFTICEQSSNFKEAEKRTFLHKDYPLTELREEYSIFSNVSNMVINTNIQNVTFKCYYDTGKFVIQYESYL